MKLLKENKLGLIVSGIKNTGRSVFFCINLKETENELVKQIEDINRKIQEKVDDFFYLKNFSECTEISLVRIIFDNQGRTCYISFSLIISSKYEIKQPQITNILNEILNVYKTNYFNNSHRETIINGVNENTLLFQNILIKYDHNLIPKSNISYYNETYSNSEDRIYLFDSPSELDSLISDYRRKQFLIQGRIFLLPSSNKKYFENYPIFPIPTIEKQLILTIKTIDSKSRDRISAHVLIKSENETRDLYSQGKIEEFFNGIDDFMSFRIEAQNENYEIGKISFNIDFNKDQVSNEGKIFKNITLELFAKLIIPQKPEPIYGYRENKESIEKEKREQDERESRERERRERDKRKRKMIIILSSIAFLVSSIIIYWIIPPPNETNFKQIETEIENEQEDSNKLLKIINKINNEPKLDPESKKILVANCNIFITKLRGRNKKTYDLLNTYYNKIKQAKEDSSGLKKLKSTIRNDAQLDLKSSITLIAKCDSLLNNFPKEKVKDIVNFENELTIKIDKFQNDSDKLKKILTEINNNSQLNTKSKVKLKDKCNKKINILRTKSIRPIENKNSKIPATTTEIGDWLRWIKDGKPNEKFSSTYNIEDAKLLLEKKINNKADYTFAVNLFSRVSVSEANDLVKWIKTKYPQYSMKSNN